MKKAKGGAIGSVCRVDAAPPGANDYFNASVITVVLPCETVSRIWKW